jgi:hypothetical protein
MASVSVKEQKPPRIDNYLLLCVPPDQVEKFWPHVEILISRAFLVGGGDDTPNSTRQRLNDGKAQLWIVLDDRKAGGELTAAATTELILTPKEKICVITSCAGKDLRRWDRFIADLEKFARDEGCAKLRIYGRRGWRKILSGYREPWITLEKSIV